MSLTQTEKLGFGENFVELVVQVAPELAGTPLDGKEILKDVVPKQDRAARANAKQEDAKRASLAATAEVEAAVDDFYRTCSGYLDAIMGVVGKGSPAAKNMGRLRSRIRMREDAASEATTPGGTAPGAVQ